MAIEFVDHVPPRSIVAVWVNGYLRWLVKAKLSLNEQSYFIRSIDQGCCVWKKIKASRIKQVLLAIKRPKPSH